MNPVREVCLLPRIDEADYTAFRAVLGNGNSDKALPSSYEEWLTVIAARRRGELTSGCLVREIPVNILQFSAFCERTGVERPTMGTLDRFIVESARF
jgi:hypothetical protein